MKIPKVDSLLGSIKLETGGLIIGWICAICDVILYIVAVGLLVFLCQYDCDELSKSLKDGGYVDLDENLSLVCSYGSGIVIGALAFLVALSIGLFVIAFLCIRGIYRRNHNYVKPMVVLLGVSTVLSFIPIFLMNNILELLTLIIRLKMAVSAIYAYSFIVMYSLYCVFEEEYTRRRTVQNYPPVPQHCPKVEKV